MFVFEDLTAARRKILLQLENKLGVKFNKIELLNTALTHSSYANEKGKIFDNNERLEYLGDAVLELASSTYLFNNFGNMTEGELTRTRATVVCQDTLSKLAIKLGLGKIILLGHGEDTSGGRNRESTLEDVFEAVIGAIYLDNGWEVARDYIFRQLAPEFDKIRAGKKLKDYKTQLQELVQQNPDRILEYVELGESGPDHMKTFKCAVKIDNKIFGTGIGKSKKQAEQMAAQQAIDKILEDN